MGRWAGHILNYIASLSIVEHRAREMKCKRAVRSSRAAIYDLHAFNFFLNLHNAQAQNDKSALRAPESVVSVFICTVALTVALRTASSAPAVICLRMATRCVEVMFQLRTR